MVIEFILKILDGIEEERRKWFRKLREHYPHHPRNREFRRVVQVCYIFIENQNFILMANLSLKPGKRYTITNGLIDHILGTAVPGATMVRKSATVDNAAVALVDADGKVAYVGAGKANLTIVNTWTFDDANNPGDSVTEDITSVVEITCLQGVELVDQTTDLTNEEDIPVAQPQA